MQELDKIRGISYLLLMDKYPEEFIEKLSKLLVDCFDNQHGFLKAQTVYDLGLCPELKFKLWRQVLIKMDYIEYPAYTTELWRHFPGKKIAKFFPDFVHTTEIINGEFVKKLANEIEKLKRDIYFLQQKDKEVDKWRLKKDKEEPYVYRAVYPTKSSTAKRAKK